MKPQFEDLHVGQKVWLDGKETIIKALERQTNGDWVKFVEDHIHSDYHYDNISLTPPGKKRYWQWKLKAMGVWQRDPLYYDNDGLNTHGGIYSYWSQTEKERIEEDFIDL